MERIQRIAGVIARVEEYCLAGAILAITGLTIVNVLTRTLIGASLAATEEVCRFGMVFVTFVGMAHAASRGRHIRMTALHDAVSQRARKRLMLLVTFGTSLLSAYLCWLSLAYVFGTVRPLGAVSPVLSVPKWLVYSSAPLGLGLCTLQYALAFARNLQTPAIYLSASEVEQADGPEVTPAGGP